MTYAIMILVLSIPTFLGLCALRKMATLQPRPEGRSLAGDGVMRSAALVKHWPFERLDAPNRDERRFEGLPLDAYNSEAIKLFSAALNEALAEIEASRLKPLARSQRASLPGKITWQLIAANDAGVRDLDPLKRASWPTSADILLVGVARIRAVRPQVVGALRRSLLARGGINEGERK